MSLPVDGDKNSPAPAPQWDQPPTQMLPAVANAPASKDSPPEPSTGAGSSSSSFSSTVRAAAHTSNQFGASSKQSSRRLRDLLVAPIRPIHVVIALMCLVLGFALVTQIKIQRADPLDNLHEDELVVLLDQLTTSERQLRKQRNELAVQVQRLQSSHSQYEAAKEAAQKDAERAQIMAGTVAVHGPGLTMTLQEGNEPITAHSFVNILGELRNAGAEAIDVNGQRITASSYVTTVPGGLSISGFTITPPYRWSVIGDADTILPALDIPRGAISRVRGSGSTVTFERHDDLKIVSVSLPQSYRYAEVK
ncbi:MAG: DUF881 domain-containing protein [Actinomycetaceae bacterium]|nr:DUF881 domain-containing protein [Actinomycetaceae bacterium]